MPYIRAIDLDVNAETEEGKEANQKMHAHYFPADRAVGLRIPYRIETGKPIPVNVAVIDSTCKPAETRAKLSVYERNYWALGESDFRGDWKAWKKIKEYNGLTFKGKDTVTLDGLTTGDYLLKCDAIDNDGDILTTSKEFSVGYIRAYFSDDELTLKAHKARVPGEKFITLSIKAPKKGTALLTIENKKSLGYHLVTLETPHVNQKIRLPIEENYFPTVKIKAFALYEDGTYEKDSIWLAIPETKKKLNVEILPEAKELLPSTQSKLAVKVTDNQGRGKKTGVFVFAVNEATLRLTEWGRFTDLLEEFYHYNHWLFLSDMTTLVSLTQNNLYPALSASMWRENAGCIIGRITTQNGTPLPGVTVYQKGPTTYRYTAAEKKKSLSNKNGFFFLLGSRKGNYELEFKKAGYKKSSLKVRLAEHDVEEVNVTLKEKETVKEAAGAEKQKKTAAKKKFSSLARKWKITGKLLLEDGNYIPGAFAELYRRTGDQSRGVARTVTSENGDFLFDHLPKGDYLLIFQLDGFKKSFQRLQITNSDVTVNVFMETGRISEEIMVMAAGATSIAAGEEPENTGWNSSEFRDLLRKDFKENLFFQILETDETGKAELIFKTSDTLSTYEITALAYGEDIFGKAKNKIQVTRDLYLEETMPEFARKEDRFRAGVQVSNRTADTLNVEVKLKVEPPQGRLAVRRPDLKDTTLATVPSKGNKPVYYDFLAADAGEAALHFYARAGQAKDALLKKFSIFDTEVTETILDFDNGKTINKQIEPTKLTKNGGRLNLTLAPSILKPAGRIARKLIFYSYECMEQRASKVMPFLMLDDRMLTVPGIEIDSTQVRESIEAYIKIIPEYMNSQGALSYYRRGRFSNDYLTIYVYWSLQLARERGIATEAATGIIKKIETYVTKTKLSNNESCFYQYVLSRNKKANPRKLKAFYKKRDTLPLMARVFLYRAINNQLKRSRKKTKRMVAEFRNSLNIEADFAYFDAGDYSYSRHWPFYSNRFATALLLQAILEVEGAFEEAPRVIRWLLEVPTYMWETTQTNFWILSAMKQYSLTVEKKTAGKAEIAIAGETIAKAFTSKKENWEVEKKLEKEAKPFNVDVKADGNVYLTMELEYPVDGTRAATRGIKVQRNVYNKKGKRVEEFIKGATYQVELLVDFDKMLPYGVIDEPLAAGFELLREDFATTRDLEEFNTVNEKEYDTSYWVRREHSADRLIYYSYRFSGNKRFVYFIKALYSGTFTWMPTKVQGM
ncbi:MAG: hypothetical protein GY757_23155, partial [bacterium]|nr:hypothetical protein [bacterium]